MGSENSSVKEIVTFREEEEIIDFIETVAEDEDVDKTKSEIWQYYLDRRFGHRESFPTETKYNPELEGKLREYAFELDLVEEIGFEEFREGSLEYVRDVYRLAKTLGNQDLLDRTEDYIQRYFPDEDVESLLDE